MSLLYFAKIRKSVKKLKLDDLIHNLKIAYSKAHKAADRDFLLKHLSFLQEKGLDNPATQKDLDFVLKDIEKTLGQKLESLAEAPFLQASMEAYTDGKRKVCKPFKIDYSLDDADLGALNTLDEFNGWYIRDKFSKDTSDIINRELGDLLERGGTKREFAQTLEIALEGHVEESKTYWELLADHTLTKIQNMGHVSGYETAGVQYVKIVAVIDSKTTPVCRAMNNKVFKVADFRKQYDKIIHAAEKHDLKAYKAAQPMISGKAMKGEISDEDIKRLGIKLPPYHFRCRTTHVAYFEGERELKRPGNPSNASQSDDGSPVKQNPDTKPELYRQQQIISEALKSLSKKNTADFPRGFKGILYFDSSKKGEIALTDGKGFFHISKSVFTLNRGREEIEYIPLKHLSSALNKIMKEKEPTLNFLEHIAMENFYHETIHNGQKAAGKIAEFDRLARESITEYVARHTFSDHLKRMGVKKNLYEKEIIAYGNGYPILMEYFESALDFMQVPKETRTQNITRICFECEAKDMLPELSKYIAENSQAKDQAWLNMSPAEREDFVYFKLANYYGKYIELQKKIQKK